MSTRKILKYLLVGLLFVIIIVLLFVPVLSKQYLNKNGKELLGRAVHIDKIRLNYFSSTIRVIGLSIFEKNDSTEFIGFDSLKVNLKPLRLLKDEFHIQQFLLVNPRGIVFQNDTVFNFSDLMLEDSVVASDDEADTTGISYRLNLNQLEMRNGNFTYTDEQLNHSIHFNSLSFIIPQIYWNAADSSKAGLAFDLSEGGHFASTLNYKVGTGDFHGSVDVDGLELITILPYIQQQVNFSAIDGTLDTHLAFSGSSKNIENVLIHGEVALNNLVLEDNGKKVLGVDKYTATLKEIRPLQDFYELNKMEITNPYIYFALIDSTSNFEKLMVATLDSAATEQEDSVVESSEMYVRVNQFVINNGLIDFSDQRLQNEFNYELSELKLDMDTLDLVDNWVNLTGTMKLNKRGKMEAQLGLNPSNVMDSMQLDYVITDFQLPDLNIYSKHYVGLPILFGDMYYVSKTSIVHSQLESSNELIIRNVDMGRKTGGLYDVPVKLALFILKDINGDITLDVPVKGDLDDPKTKFGPIVFNTLKNFMFKIVASPFKALGGLLGASPDEINEITFDYADTALTSQQIKSLDLMLELETMKPELQTDLVYFNDKNLERLDAAQEISHQMFESEKHKKAMSSIKDYEKFLQKATGKDSLVLQDYEVLLAPAGLVDSVLTKREKLRYNMITKYLTSQNDSTTIRVLEHNPQAVLNKGSRPRFEMKVSLAEDAVNVP